MSARTFSTPAVVLKRHNVGEHDRVVTLLTRDFGKFTTIAKGVRKLTSTKRAHLEPGTYIKAYGILTKGMPLLTQAQPLNAFAGCRVNLDKLKQLAQILEMTERLFAEEQAEPLLFDQVIEILNLLDQPKSSKVFIKNQLSSLITGLGYPDLKDTEHHSLSEYVAEITDRKIKSWDFLSLPS